MGTRAGEHEGHIGGAWLVIMRVTWGSGWLCSAGLPVSVASIVRPTANESTLEEHVADLRYSGAWLRGTGLGSLEKHVVRYSGRVGTGRGGC